MPDPSQDRSVPREAVVTVDTGHPLGTLGDEIYGQFLESSFFGKIEGGVFDEVSPLAVDDDGPLNGVRADVLELARELQPGPMRWQGGNFASAYHWEDGIGRDRRPTRPSLVWGGQETNRFGIDEFLAWCEAVGAEAYLVNSALDVDEAVRWLESTNATDTAVARQRAGNGRDEPWKTRYWGIGNEVLRPLAAWPPVGRPVRRRRPRTRALHASARSGHPADRCRLPGAARGMERCGALAGTRRPRLRCDHPAPAPGRPCLVE